MTASIVLNIGWARSGSTAFRQNFLRRHPQILVVDRGQSAAEGPFAAILGSLKRDDDSAFALAAPSMLAAARAFAQTHSDRIICVSDEELSIGEPGRMASPLVIAARCGVLFPGARTLALVRDPVAVIASMHALAQRNGPAMALRDWVQRHVLAPAPGEDFGYLFDYAGTLRAYRGWQGRRDMLVLDHAALERDHAAVYRQLCRWLQISDAPCDGLPNEIVNASPPRREDGYGPGHPAQIRALYQDGNSELAREFGIVFSPAGGETAPAAAADARHAV